MVEPESGFVGMNYQNLCQKSDCWFKSLEDEEEASFIVLMRPFGGAVRGWECGIRVRNNPPLDVFHLS